jgi:hypothetical protein
LDQSVTFAQMPQTSGGKPLGGGAFMRRQLQDHRIAQDLRQEAVLRQNAIEQKERGFAGRHGVR